jgi:hypothetical protein
VLSITGVLITGPRAGGIKAAATLIPRQVFLENCKLLELPHLHHMVTPATQRKIIFTFRDVSSFKIIIPETVKPHFPDFKAFDNYVQNKSKGGIKVSYRNCKD